MFGESIDFSAGTARTKTCSIKTRDQMQPTLHEAQLIGKQFVCALSSSPRLCNTFS